MRRRSFLVGGGALAIAAADAAAAPEFSPASNVGIRVNGREIRLADIITPSRAGVAEPYADEAQRTLAAMLSGQLRAEEVGPEDRWGRSMARLYVESHPGILLATVQERLVAVGAARVRPETDDAGFIARLLKLEHAARNAALGLWRLAHYRIFAASDARYAIGGFNLVEGAPVAAAKRGGRIYLNFGADFRDDFTASVRTGLAKRWVEDGLDLMALAGASLRVRGYVASINGPSIDLVHPGQIEILDMKTPAAAGSAPA